MAALIDIFLERTKAEILETWSSVYGCLETFMEVYSNLMYNELYFTAFEMNVWRTNFA